MGYVEERANRIESKNKNCSVRNRVINCVSLARSHSIIFNKQLELIYIITNGSVNTIKPAQRFFFSCILNGCKPADRYSSPPLFSPPVARIFLSLSRIHEMADSKNCSEDLFHVRQISSTLRSDREKFIPRGEKHVFGKEAREGRLLLLEKASFDLDSPPFSHHYS